MSLDLSAIPIASPGVLAADALRDSGTRRELSLSAVRLFFRLAEQWHLTVNQRLALLGDISRQTYHNWQYGKVGTLSRDQLERISLLLGIHKGLKLLFADEAAGMRSFQSANRDLPFAGRSPLERSAAASMTSTPCAATSAPGAESSENVAV
jgi:hypothetical protein